MKIVWEQFLIFATNPLFACAFLAWLIAQLSKVVHSLFKREKCSFWKILFANGGMPSSHSSCVMALCSASGMQYGLGSPYFAITAILAAIVMIDASGVRYETGKQAIMINRIMKELFSGDPELWNTGLKELVGHTPFQVLMGALLGIFVGVGMHLWVF